MVIAIAVGVVVGLAGLVPFLAAARLAARKPTEKPVAQSAMAGLMGFAGSLVIVVVALIVCSRVSHDSVLPFGIAEIATLVIGTIILMTNITGRIAGRRTRKMNHE